MSRIGKAPITVPAAVKIDLKGQDITVKGAKSELKMKLPPEVKVAFTDGKITVEPVNDSQRARAMWGTVRTCINNLVVGVTAGFTERMEINGVGFRAAVDKGILTMSLGFSHEIKIQVPQGIEVKAEKPTVLVITGANKQRVGQFAAMLRTLRKPEPYKGKGVKYESETIRRKEGKKK
jgi:large subunit ribosomal protein L6